MSRFLWADCFGHEWFDVSGWRADGRPDWTRLHDLHTETLWDDWGWEG